MAPRHYPVPSAAPHHVPQQHVPPHPYPPPVSSEHWAPPPPPPQHQYPQYARPAPPAPAPVGPRSDIAPSQGDAEKASIRQSTLAEIYNHCRILHQFAHYYAQLQTTQPHVQPSPNELQEMSWRAGTVVRLLEDLRRISSSEDAAPRDAGHAPVASNASEEHSRPPKRPWEDMSREEEGNAAPSAPYPDQQPQVSYNGVDDKSTAEADMEIIRSKRATSTGGATPGQPKSKYRKRSRATPPGKCHSCNIRETPEWRRGPDGARTLCNACGLHYAKLMRKRDKGADGKPAPIDLQTLRASTQSARGAEQDMQNQHPPHPQPQVHHQATAVASIPYEQQKQPAPPPQPMHASHHSNGHAPHGHPGPYQLMPVGSSHAQAAPQQPPHHQMMGPPPPPASGGHSESQTVVSVPPPPWMTSGSSSSNRSGYASEHQSYMRTSHPPSHARASPQ
ncbi:uncharacterized protein FIBRA_03562 [Fibroporia radiculosa]|uniref:GATA-type domain-containing protein n=1 Tax=Fibroporia radiculosa TaxID=599839 RepID=J4I9P2_9APHY|nr:uncharacterized protein FIBRA_03562 [Fibroporia radiculosa]CCM01506.1 predicted protein [Fibroporia radiculosa]